MYDIYVHDIRIRPCPFDQRSCRTMVWHQVMWSTLGHLLQKVYQLCFFGGWTAYDRACKCKRIRLESRPSTNQTRRTEGLWDFVVSPECVLDGCRTHSRYQVPPIKERQILAASNFDLICRRTMIYWIIRVLSMILFKFPQVQDISHHNFYNDITAVLFRCHRPCRSGQQSHQPWPEMSRNVSAKSWSWILIKIYDNTL